MRAMKDSGIEWVGKIPQEWNVRKTKGLFSVISGATPKSEKTKYWGGDIIWITPSDMSANSCEITSSNRSITNDGLASCGTTLVPKGSIIISNRAPIGLISIAGIELCTNQGCKSLVKNTKLFERYFYYFFTTQELNLNVLGRGTTFLELSSFSLENYYLPLPPFSEQQLIAAYLDKKCSQIESIIDKQQTIIEKLKAYKQSVITEAVTKGLDPTAPMKDSGIEWIGKIQQGWKINKVGRFYNIQLGKMLQPDRLNENETLEPYMCSANINWQGINLNTIKRMWFSESEKESYLLKKGDLLVAEGGDVGVACIWNDEICNCYIQNAVHRVRSKAQSHNKYLYYWLYVLKNVGHIDLICNKATIAHFTKDKFSNSIFVWSPKAEQTAISAYLDKKCAKIDKIIELKQKLIDRFNDYKKSLIFEAVTGKIEISTKEENLCLTSTTKK